MSSLDFISQRTELVFFSQINLVGMLDSLHLSVSRNGDHIKIVNFHELGRFGHRRACHARQFLVHLEDVLQRCSRKGLRFLFDRHAFFGFDGLVKPVAPLAAFHQSPSELVDDDNLPILDHIVDIQLVKKVPLQGIVDQVRPFHIASGVETFHAGKSFSLANTFVGQRHVVLFFVNREVRFLFQLPCNPISFLVTPKVQVSRTADDQWRTCFVDQNIVDFVNDGVIQWPLALLHFSRKTIVVLCGRAHVVAKVIETKFVVRSVSDVARISSLLCISRHPRLDCVDCQSKVHVKRRHPFHVTTRQVIIDGDDVDALAFKCVQVRRQRGNKRLTFTGHHFSDTAKVQHHAADQLYVVMTHAHMPLAALATNREGILKNVIKTFAIAKSLTKHLRLLRQFFIAERSVLRFKRGDRFGTSLKLRDLTSICRSEHCCDAAFDRSK